MIGEVLLALGGVGFGGLTGGVVGWTAHVVRARRRRPVERQPICGCGHHLSMHDPRTGECHEVNRVRDGYDKRDNPQYRYARCTCRHYVGPEPLAEFVAPELPVEDVSRQIVSAPRTDEIGA